jgi:hypothetical protein
LVVSLNLTFVQTGNQPPYILHTLLIVSYSTRPTLPHRYPGLLSWTSLSSLNTSRLLTQITSTSLSKALRSHDMALATQQVAGLHVIWLDDEFLGEVTVSGWYALSISVATTVDTSQENLTGLVDRHPEFCANGDVLRLTRPDATSARWNQLVEFYDKERGTLDRPHKRKKKRGKRKRPVQNLTLFPLALVAEVMNYYVGKGTCSEKQVRAVDALVEAPKQQRPGW